MQSTKFAEEVARMSAATASVYVHKMLVREIEEGGSRDRAYASIERKYGITRAQQRHLREGRAKTIDTGLFARVRAAYLDYNERQIRKLQAELALERAMGGDPDNLDNLEAEARQLLAKVSAAKNTQF